jgi:hypothetical protein
VTCQIITEIGRFSLKKDSFQALVEAIIYQKKLN